LDGSEDDILWEDDGEDKDDSDWVTDNNSVMSGDGESDEFKKYGYHSFSIGICGYFERQTLQSTEEQQKLMGFTIT
jgi:hypothetical protein